MVIDTHAHIYSEEFDVDGEQMLTRAREAGIAAIIMPNVDLASMPRMLSLVHKYPQFVWPLAGLHPCSVHADFRQTLNGIEQYLTQEEFIGIGEVGLDLYWDRTFEREQEEAFLIQSGWAQSRHWPVIIHSRDAVDRLILLIRSHYDRQLTGIFHCFSGSVEQARAIMDQGFYLGIGGVITYKKSTLPEVLKTIGLERIVLETDAPYLSPVPYRGKRNEPAHLNEVLHSLSNVLNLAVEEVAEITSHNAQQVFKKLLIGQAPKLRSSASTSKDV